MNHHNNRKLNKRYRLCKNSNGASNTKLVLISGTTHPTIAKIISERLGIPLCNCIIKKRENGNLKKINVIKLILIN